MPKWMPLVLISVLAVLAGIANMTLAIRDGTLTTAVPSFKSSDIIANGLWSEAPMQVLHTFMGAGSSMLFSGRPSDGGLQFSDRLRFKLGNDQVDSSRSPLDLREILDAEELALLESFAQAVSYRSVQPCPHHPIDDCIIAVGWNRERTREPGARWVAVRITEDTYLIVDDSIVRAG